MKLLNALSLNMLPCDGEIYVETLDNGFLDRYGRDGIESCIGHADTARVLGVKMNRENFQFPAIGGQAVVAQYTGPRLPEGATQLPEGAKISFKRVVFFPKKEVLK